MKIAIRYYSRTGNTEKVAKEIGKQLDITPKTISEPLINPVGELLLGGGTYFLKADKHIRDFVTKIKPNQAKRIIVFGTSSGLGTMANSLKKALTKKGFVVSSKSLFLHGLSPQIRNLNEKQKEKIEQFTKKI